MGVGQPAGLGAGRWQDVRSGLLVLFSPQVCDGLICQGTSQTWGGNSLPVQPLVDSRTFGANYWFYSPPGLRRTPTRLAKNGTAKGRIVQLHRIVGPATVVRGLLPRRSCLSRALEHPVRWGVRAGPVLVGQEGDRRVDAEGLDPADELAVFLCEGEDGRHGFDLRAGRAANRPRRHDDWPGAGTGAPLAAPAQRRAEAGGYFVPRGMAVQRPGENSRRRGCRGPGSRRSCPRERPDGGPGQERSEDQTTACSHAGFVAGVRTMMIVMFFGVSRSFGMLRALWSYLANALLLAQFPVLHSMLPSRRGDAVLHRVAPCGLRGRLARTIYASVASVQIGLLFALWPPSGTRWQRNSRSPATRWLPLLGASASARPTSSIIIPSTITWSARSGQRLPLLGFSLSAARALASPSTAKIDAPTVSRSRLRSSSRGPFAIGREVLRLTPASRGHVRVADSLNSFRRNSAAIPHLQQPSAGQAQDAVAAASAEIGGHFAAPAPSCLLPTLPASHSAHAGMARWQHAGERCGIVRCNRSERCHLECQTHNLIDQFLLRIASRCISLGWRQNGQCF